jgi:hypothetical protein
VSDETSGEQRAAETKTFSALPPGHPQDLPYNAARFMWRNNWNRATKTALSGAISISRKIAQ